MCNRETKTTTTRSSTSFVGLSCRYHQFSPTPPRLFLHNFEFSQLRHSNNNHNNESNCDFSALQLRQLTPIFCFWGFVPMRSSCIQPAFNKQLIVKQ